MSKVIYVNLTALPRAIFGKRELMTERERYKRKRERKIGGNERK